LKKNAMGLASLVLGAFGVQTGGKKQDALNEASELKVIGVGYGRTGTVSLLSSLILLMVEWDRAMSSFGDRHARFISVF
jgi:hypothetical protein